MRKSLERTPDLDGNLRRVEAGEPATCRDPGRSGGHHFVPRHMMVRMVN
jgi:hypothetical protein